MARHIPEHNDQILAVMARPLYVGATPPALEVLVTVRAEPLISVRLVISVGRLAAGFCLFCLT